MQVENVLLLVLITSSVPFSAAGQEKQGRDGIYLRNIMVFSEY